MPSWRLLGPEGEPLEASLPAYSLVERMLSGSGEARRAQGTTSSKRGGIDSGRSAAKRKKSSNATDGSSPVTLKPVLMSKKKVRQVAAR